MERKQKFDMLSVVAFGIHTEVRERLQRAIESSQAHPRLDRILKPIYFYEYFFNTPVLRGEDPSQSVAFAPFLPRLIVERDFMAIPRRGFDAAFSGPSYDWKNVRMVPTTKDNVSEHWPEHVSFEKAVPKSLTLRLLHQGWLSILKEGVENQNNGLARKPLREYHSKLTTEDKQPFVELEPNAFSNNEGTVSLAAGFSRKFAERDYQQWWKAYAKESRDSWDREFLACIHPWIVSSPGQAAQGSSDRLFEILACSISSRCLFFGQLILFIPPIEEPELRSWACKLLRSVLHDAVEDLYLPMLTLYENYEAECDLEVVLEDQISRARRNSNEWCRYPAFREDRWNHLIEPFGSLGSDGTASTILAPWPAPTADSTSDPARIPFLRIARLIPLSTSPLRRSLQSLGRVLRHDDTQAKKIAIEAARRSARSLINELEGCAKVDETLIWVKALKLQLHSVLKSLKRPADLNPGSVDEIRMKLGNVERRFARMLSDLELNLAQLWADRVAWMYRTPKAVLESLVFSRYLIASPGMVKCIRSAMNIGHRRQRRSVKTALIVGGAGSGKDSMARVVQVFSPGYRFGSRTVLNMAMFRPKEIAVPFLLGMDLRYQKRTRGTTTELGLAGVFQQVLSSAPQREQSVEEEAVGSESLATARGEDHSIRGFTFILDELNSLDIDSQGALLRLLENAELQALGCIEPIWLDCLVVSVMNEDPELIMKKRALDSLLRDESLFGGVVGETLYELLRGQRRLRDDLYYRLARGGEIRIPELRYRREDIPILTYFILRQYIKSIPEVSTPDEWDVDLAVYEALMRPSLSWRGNIRELQAVCRRMLDLALAYQKLTGSPKLEILTRHAEEALASLSAETDRQPGETRGRGDER